jgi:predicted RNase H-like HicB family nuclease
MKTGPHRLEFTGAIFKEDKWFVSLCLELDVASQGRTALQAKKMLAEAVSLYLESCFENNSPYLRPVPAKEDPRRNPTANLVEIFPLKAEFKVHTED